MADYPFTKAHHLLVYLISKMREPGSIELMKVTYLIDVEYYRLFGKSLSNFNYIRGKFGPYSPEFSKIDSELENNGFVKTISQSRGSSISKKAHLSVKSKFRPELLPEEKEVIDELLKRLSNLSQKRLVEKSYKTEPMQEILEDEKKLGKKLIGSPLNFSSIQRDGFMGKWLKNRKKFCEEEPDLEYEGFLLSEKQAFTNWVNS